MKIDNLIKEVTLIEGIKNKERRIKSLLETPFSDKDILKIFEYVKSEEAGLLLKNIGFPVLNNYLLKMLELLQDINWSINRYTIDMLIKKADKYLVIDAVKEVFKNYSYDSIWQSFIIFYLLKNLPKKYQKLITKELTAIALRADQDSACIYAANILFEKKLIKKNVRNSIFNFLKESFKGNNDYNYELKYLEEMLN
jgi:Domain of unknown function (DUF5071)